MTFGLFNKNLKDVKHAEARCLCPCWGCLQQANDSRLMKLELRPKPRYMPIFVGDNTNKSAILDNPNFALRTEMDTGPERVWALAAPNALCAYKWTAGPLLLPAGEMPMLSIKYQDGSKSKLSVRNFHSRKGSQKGQSKKVLSILSNPEIVLLLQRFFISHIIGVHHFLESVIAPFKPGCAGF